MTHAATLLAFGLVPLVIVAGCRSEPSTSARAPAAHATEQEFLAAAIAGDPGQLVRVDALGATVVRGPAEPHVPFGELRPGGDLVLAGLKARLGRMKSVVVSKDERFHVSLGALEVVPDVPFLKVAAVDQTMGDAGFTHIDVRGLEAHLPAGSGRLLARTRDREMPAIHLFVTSTDIRVEGGDEDGEMPMNAPSPWGFDRPRLQALLASAVGGGATPRRVLVGAAADVP